jgi:hypothetical protein
VSRATWLCGWSGGIEPIGVARARSLNASRRLIGLANEHGRVALVGHGMMNLLIARHLRRAGWTGHRPPTTYWGTSQFRREPGQ